MLCSATSKQNKAEIKLETESPVYNLLCVLLLPLEPHRISLITLRKIYQTLLLASQAPLTLKLLSLVGDNHLSPAL